MTIDKRLSEEFGTPLPPVSYTPPGERIAEWVIGHLVHLTIIPALLATGALLGRYYPPAVWWLFGFSGVAALCIAALYVVALIASASDDPMDDRGGYPGS